MSHRPFTEPIENWEKALGYWATAIRHVKPADRNELLEFFPAIPRFAEVEAHLGLERAFAWELFLDGQAEWLPKEETP